MSFFSRRQPHSISPNLDHATRRKARRPEGVSRRRKKELGFESLEDRRVMSAQSPFANLEYESYSSATPEGQAAILQQELYRQLLQSLQSSGNIAYVPNAIPTDPLLNNQWHLINSGQQVGNPIFQPIYAIPGQDINVAGAWNQGITGNGVVVAVFDSGVQTSHPDLIANLHAALGLDAIDGDSDANPIFVFPNDPTNAHGTAVAGLIGATSDNGLGGTGVAPGVQLVPVRLIDPTDLTQDPSAFVNAFRYAIDQIDITNNSWGPGGTIVGRGIAGPTADELLAIIDSIEFGRDELGVIHVFAAGNNANLDETLDGVLDTSAYNGWVNSRYVIGVTGVDHDGEYNNIDGTITNYMETSAAILVAAPTGSVALTVGLDSSIGSGIWTTDTTASFSNNPGFNGANNNGGVNGDRDFLADLDYTSRFNGTSASAPLVSGVIALMLEANPNLTWRDVQEILVRSSRQNAEFATQQDGADKSVGVEYQSSWIINQVPLFHDPDDHDPLIPWELQLIHPTLDAGLTRTTVGAHYSPTPQVLTNGAGYTVSQGRGTDRDQMGYAHGVIDAELAVALAQQWTTKGQHLADELSFTTRLNTFNDGTLPAAERILNVDGTADFIVPGGLGGLTGFGDYWAEYLAGADADFTGITFDRGAPLELSVPSPNDMVVESVEVIIEVADDTNMSEFLDNVRIVLVSPNGTHSELNYYHVDSAFGAPDDFHQAGGLDTYGISGLLGFANPNGFDAVTALQADAFNAGSTDTGVRTFSFTTKRSWGERSDNALIIDPTTGNPVIDPLGVGGNLNNSIPETSDLGDLLTQGWQLHFENYSGTSFNIPGIEVVWHGTPIEANTERIAGLIGIDNNRDDAFNYSRVIQQTTNFLGDDPNSFRLGEVQNVIDPNHESMAANITVKATRVSDGAVVAQFVTGADGNFFFDLVPDDYIISIEDPEGRIALQDNQTPNGFMREYQTQWRITPEHFQVWNHDANLNVPVDANGVPQAFLDGTGAAVTYGMSGINFLLDPGQPALPQVEFSGTIAADFNGDGNMNGNDVGVPGVKVYADVNRNGVFDAGEIVVTTNASGQYNLIVPNTISTVMNVGVIAPVNWTFGDPADGFSPLFVEPGDTFEGIDFQLTPPLGASTGDGSSNAGYLMGAVYEDANNNGSRQSTETGVSGIQVFIDTNNNGTREVNEATTTTNANGAYIFANVAPGVHRVRAVPVAPLLSINPGPGVPKIVTVNGGGTTSQIEFGIGLGSNPSSQGMDFGDLPAAYGITLLSENGARHSKSAYYLGARVDVELNGTPSNDANGDNLIGVDEDGIIVDPLIPGTTGHLVAIASRHGGNLQGWIDFNGDNVFQASEKVISNVALQPGANDVYFQIPATITSGNVYARFRYGEYGINSPTGAAVIGEVEDYLLAKDPSAIPAVIEHGPDFDEDGDIDGRDFLSWQRNHGATNATAAQGDANSDGSVGYHDLVLWRNYYGTPSGYSAYTADDEEELSALAAEDMSDQVAAGLLGDEEDSTLVEVLLIVDTYDPQSLTSVTEASAQSSTAYVPMVSISNGFEVLFADDEFESTDSTFVTSSDDLDAAFESSNELLNLGVALRDSSDRQAASRYLRGDDFETEDDDNSFELAFSEEAEWRQF